MANVVDSLVVELLLETKKFIQGQQQFLTSFKKTQEEANKQAKALEERARRTNQVLSSIKTQALSLIGIFLAGRGIKEFVQYITTSDAALNRFSRAFNVSVTDLKKWQVAVELAGGQAEEVTTSFSAFSNALMAFQHGIGDPTWRARVAQVVGDLDPGADTVKNFERITKRLQEIQKLQGTKEAYFLGTQLGISPGVLNLMLHNTEEMFRVAERIASTTKEDADAAERRLKSWNEFLEVSTRLGKVFATWLTPALEKVTDLLERWLGVAKPGEGGEASTENLRKRFGEPTKEAQEWGQSFLEGLPNWLQNWWSPSPQPPWLSGFQPAPAPARPVRGAAPSALDAAKDRLRRGIPSGSPTDLLRFWSPQERVGAAAPVTHNSEVNIAQITVNAPGGDADDIARNISGAIRRRMAGGQVDYGLA